MNSPIPSRREPGSRATAGYQAPAKTQVCDAYLKTRPRHLSPLKRRLVVTLLAGRDLLPCGIRAKPVAHLGLHALKLFVGAEEGRDFALPVRLQVGEVVNVAEMRV